MALARQSKPFLQFTAGIFTEGNPLNRPENTSVDEQNFEILRKGYRRRRFGLDVQRDPSTGTASYEHVGPSTSASANEKFNFYRWDHVGGDPDKVFHVCKRYDDLYFFEEVDGELVARSDTIQIQGNNDPSNFLTGGSNGVYGLGWGSKYGTTYRSTVQDEKLHFSSGNGYLFVTGKYMNEFYVEYDAANDILIGHAVDPIERALEDVPDGYGIATQPTVAGTDFTWNLYNRGWDSTKLGTGSGEYRNISDGNSLQHYPGKNEIWSYGKYISTTLNGEEAFKYSNIVKQDFGNVTAPIGRYLKRIFNASTDHKYRFQLSSARQVTSVTRTSSTVATVTLAGGLSVAVNAYVMFLNGTCGKSTDHSDTRFFYGVHQVATSTSNTFTINNLNITGTNGDQFDALDDMYIITWTGSVAETCYSILNYAAISPVDTYEHFHVNAFHAQRLWLAGHTDQKLGRRLYYSQVVESPVNIGAFYQRNDPTSEHISDLLASDGGYVSIPDMGQVQNMFSFGHWLIAMADNGVWAVGPGDAGYFRADDYSVIRLSKSDVLFPEAAVETEDMVFFWTTAGLMAVASENISGTPKVHNITETSIDTLYQDIIKGSTHAVGTYDEAEKRLIFLYRYAADESTATLQTYQFSRALILNLAIGAWYRYTFSVPVTGTYTSIHHIVGIGTTKELYSDTSHLKIFGYMPEETTTRRIYPYEFVDNETFVDWPGFWTGSGYNYSTYLDTTYEHGGDVARPKYASYLTCHFNRTETEAVASGIDLVLKVQSGCQLTTYWDWTDSAVGGKKDGPREVYRLKRYFQPDTVGAWDNGYPVTTTKNRIRGSGKALQLHFEVPDGKDCQLLGWQLDWGGVSET